LNRKLLILNIALGVGVVYAGFALHSAWVTARGRQARMPGPPPKAPFVAPVAPLPQQPAVLPSTYARSAQNDLFDPSRNPDLPLPEPPKPAPPPVPPPLPAYHGMMDLGDPQGPIALITQPGAPGHEEVHAGEPIGQFKLLTFDRQEMTLEWQGQVIHKRLNEGGSEPARPQAAAVSDGAPAPPPLGIIPGVAPPQQAEAPRQQVQELGPGLQVVDGIRACQPGDTSAPGTVNGGFRKELNPSPMGTQCLWRAVGK